MKLLLFIHQIREDHPTMGARDMYFELQPRTMGRDTFENFCREEGLMSKKVKNWRRTTDSTGVIRSTYIRIMQLFFSTIIEL